MGRRLQSRQLPKFKRFEFSLCFFLTFRNLLSITTTIKSCIQPPDTLLLCPSLRCLRLTSIFEMHILSLLFLCALSSVSAAQYPPPSLGHFSSATTPENKGPSVAGWYPAWLGSDWPPSNISWHKYTAMNFAFAYAVKTNPAWSPKI